MSGCGGKPIPDQYSQMSVAVIPTQTLACTPAHTHTRMHTLTRVLAIGFPASYAMQRVVLKDQGLDEKSLFFLCSFYLSVCLLFIPPVNFISFSTPLPLLIILVISAWRACSSDVLLDGTGTDGYKG